MNRTRRNFILFAIAFAGWSGSPHVSVLAQAPENPATGKPLEPRKPVITMDEKVAMANHIFIGTGHRIYYVDRLLKEVGSEEEAFKPSRYSTYAILQFAVDRTLYTKGDTAHKVVLSLTNGSTEPFGAQGSGYDKNVTKYINRPGIFFGEARTTKIRVDGESGQPSRVGDEVTLHQFPVPYAIDGPLANPLPLSYLQEVVQAINRLKEKERAAATPTAPQNASKAKR